MRDPEYDGGLDLGRRPGDGDSSRARLRIVVGLRAAGMNGIETYADEVAAAGAAAGHDVTLLVTNDRVAEGVRAQLPSEVRVESLDMPDANGAAAAAGRVWDELAMYSLDRRLGNAIHGRLGNFDLAHVNRAALSRRFRSLAPVVVTAAWFYPHTPWRRVSAAWEHNGGPVVRRVALAAKSFSYYRGDRRGFAHADRIVAPTQLLADQLRSQGLPAQQCPPPVHPPRVNGATWDSRENEPIRLIAVCGDLTHPRKNIGDAVRAASAFASEFAAGVNGQARREVSLELIGRNAAQVVAGGVPRVAGLSISTPGAMDRRDVYERVHSADVLLVPSRYEEWGYVAVEALMLGTAVVTYPVYPFPSMLADGLGFVAGGPTPQDMARAIDEAIAGPRTVAAREARARAAMSKFGAAAVGARLSTIWHRAVADGEASRRLRARSAGSRDNLSGAGPRSAPGRRS